MVDSVKFNPFAFITVGTDAKFDEKVIPMFEKFAKEHGFESDIKPGYKGLGGLDERAKEIVSRLKTITENDAQPAFIVETDAFTIKGGSVSKSSCQDGGCGVKKTL